MSGTSSPHSGLTRRSFLKATGAAAGALGLAGAGAMTATEGWLAPTQAHADGGDERRAYTYHQFHCGNACAIACTVRNGRLVSVQPNDCCSEHSKTMCLRAASEIQHIYGDHRIQTPLKRVGERGSNEFVPVSWDEALDDLCDTIRNLQKEHGRNCVLVSASSESNFPWLASVLGAQQDKSSGIDLGIGNGLDPAIGNSFPACATCEARDWVNSKMVLTVGSNYLESSLATARQFFEAKEAGARMVTVDPYFSVTAGKSDQWIPIVPGTDAALFLGMATVMLQENIYDEEFVLSHTSFPFLVDTETGLLVREHASGSEDIPETGAQNPFYVWDASTNAKVPYEAEGAAPALEGEFEADGTRYATVFTLFKKAQEAYSASWAEGVCGIPAATIEELARAYADGPACLALGWGGNEKFTNADIAGHAAAVLAALTGNIGRKGAGVGVFVGGWWNGRVGALGSWKLPEDMAPAKLEMPISAMRTESNSIRAAVFCGDVLQQRMANMGKSTAWAQGLDLIVSIDPYFTEGAKWADYVLPACSRFECDEDVGNVKSCNNTIVLQGKVIDPLFEAKTDFWIGKEIARRFGADRHLPRTSEEWVTNVLASSPDPSLSRLTIDKLSETQGVHSLAGIEEPRREFLDLAFKTPSTRMDVYYENMVEFGQALPSYESPTEAGEDNPLKRRYPLQLSNARTRYRIHNQFNDAKWLQQYGELRLELNPVELERRGLSTGDTVEVFNDRGSFSCLVQANEAVRPGCARMFEGQTADYLVAGNMQNVTNDSEPARRTAFRYGAVIPFSDTVVEIRKA